MSSVFHDHVVRELRSTRIECDEIWAFCVTRERLGKPAVAEGEGTVWTWTAIDPDSKLMASWYVSFSRDEDDARRFMYDLHSRLANRVQLSTDGLSSYVEAVAHSFGRNVDFAQIIRPKDLEDPTQLQKARKVPVFGNPDMELVTTNHVERQNLTMRMSLKRFTRETNAFSKKVENHCHALSLYFYHYNFCRKHLTIGRTPAEELGLSAYPLNMRNLVELIDRASPAPRRKPYGKRRN